MKAQTLFISMLLACSIHASDGTKPTAAQQYPFSDLDRELFLNLETQKMESPFSTASVNAFAKSTLVTIEEDAYDKLRAYALERSESKEIEFVDAVRNTPQENYKWRTRFQHIAAASSTSCEQFKLMQPSGSHSQKVQLSPHDLAHLLQWSNGITTAFLVMMTCSKHDFMIEIKLGDTVFTAPPLLKDFIIMHGDHQQETNTRWAGEQSNS